MRTLGIAGLGVFCAALILAPAAGEAAHEDTAGLRLHVAAESGGLEAWQTRDVTCSPTGVRATLPAPQGQLPPSVLTLVYPTTADLGKPAKLTDPAAVELGGGAAAFRLLEGYLRTSPDRRAGMLEAALMDEADRMLWVSARWVCGAGRATKGADRRMASAKGARGIVAGMADWRDL